MYCVLQPETAVVWDAEAQVDWKRPVCGWLASPPGKIPVTPQGGAEYSCREDFCRAAGGIQDKETAGILNISLNYFPMWPKVLATVDSFPYFVKAVSLKSINNSFYAIVYWVHFAIKKAYRQCMSLCYQMVKSFFPYYCNHLLNN